MKLGSICLALTLLGLVFSAGCSGYTPTGGPGKLSNPSLMAAASGGHGLLKVNSIAVAPVEFSQDLTGVSLKEIGANESLMTAMMDELDLAVYSDQQVASLLGKNGGKIGAAKALGADAVLLTEISEFSERVGSRIGSDAPARVAFNMSIVRAKDGAELWKASYSFKDEALTDNLFHIKKRGETGKVGFKSARDLLMNGFRLASKDFAKTRNEQFQGLN